jgi:hypothetical protein
MATQQEINQIIGTWAANFSLLASKVIWPLTPWFKKYIAPIYTGKDKPTITEQINKIQTEQSRIFNLGSGLPSRVQSIIARQRAQANRDRANKYFGKEMFKLLASSRAELAGLLNQTGINPADAQTALTDLDKIISSLQKTFG